MHKILPSEDGSHTLLSEQFGVTYHSTHGAIQETQTVFIDAGLQYQIDQGLQEINILEMGFGTGLNAIMTYQYLQDKDTQVNYHTIEAYPISLEMAQQLNYPTLLSLNENQQEDFYSMHENTEGNFHHFNFKKSITQLQEISLAPNQYDIIYFDAFAPSSQEELWTEDIMQKLYNTAREGGVLVTYCAKGVFKRRLKSVGFTVEGLPGPKGKREMTRAIK